VPPVSGPGVPVAAVSTQADGTTTVVVVDQAGARTPRTVKVRGSQDGVAVVDGVNVGDHVQVFAATPGGATPASPAPTATPSR